MRDSTFYLELQQTISDLKLFHEESQQILTDLDKRLDIMEIKTTDLDIKTHAINRMIAELLTRFAAPSFKNAMDNLAENKYQYKNMSASEVEALADFFSSFIRPSNKPFDFINISEMEVWLESTFRNSDQVVLKHDKKKKTLAINKSAIQELVDNFKD